MRVREMHPLCCVLLESGAIEEQSPEPTARLLRTGSAVVGSEVCGVIGSESATSVAGVLYKWTNYHTGWRSRWFTLRNGILSYSKTRRPGVAAADDGVKLIGHLPSNNPGQRKLRKTVRIVHLKVSSFRESRSDDRKFYIFTATKTLHLRTNSKKERAAWIEALVSTRNLFMRGPANDNISLLPRDISISTEKLKSRLIDEGISEGLIKDCEKIMLSEFSEVQAQLKVLSEERSSLLDTLRQLEAANIEAESSGILDGEYQLLKHEYSNLGRGKFGGTHFTPP